MKIISLYICITSGLSFSRQKKRNKMLFIWKKIEFWGVKGNLSRPGSWKWLSEKFSTTSKIFVTKLSFGSVRARQAESKKVINLPSRVPLEFSRNFARGRKFLTQPIRVEDSLQRKRCRVLPRGLRSKFSLVYLLS